MLKAFKNNGFIKFNKYVNIITAQLATDEKLTKNRKSMHQKTPVQYFL